MGKSGEKKNYKKTFAKAAKIEKNNLYKSRKHYT